MAINIENLQLEELSANVKRAGGYFLGITRNGTISIYRGFFDRENITEVEYVLIVRDKANPNVIGLKFYKDKPEGKSVLKINKAKDNKSNAWVYAGPVLEFYKFNLADLSGKYVPVSYKISDAETAYLIDIKDKVPKKPAKTPV